jgi:hypothetical protein
MTIKRILNNLAESIKSNRQNKNIHRLEAWKLGETFALESLVRKQSSESRAEKYKNESETKANSDDLTDSIRGNRK